MERYKPLTSEEKEYPQLENLYIATSVEDMKNSHTQVWEDIVKWRKQRNFFIRALTSGVELLTGKAATAAFVYIPSVRVREELDLRRGKSKIVTLYDDSGSFEAQVDVTRGGTVGYERFQDRSPRDVMILGFYNESGIFPQLPSLTHVFHLPVQKVHLTLGHDYRFSLLLTGE